MRLVMILAACLLFVTEALAKGDIKDTTHNLSISGPGKFKSKTESRLCIFCHTPHRATRDAPLWNRRLGTITLYESSTMDAEPAETKTGSRVCLSCHDGTIALGDMLSNRSWRAQGALDLRESVLKGRANLKADMADDHPVAIMYDEQLELADPQLAEPGSVDLPMRNNEIQCTTCHDPHDDSSPPFLHKSTRNGELCTTCHVSSGLNWEWETSSHAISSVTPRGTNPWPQRKPEWAGNNVKENACMNCHSPHNAETPARLINGKEEETCFRCHNGTVAFRNIKSNSKKFYRHPVEKSSATAHEAVALEDPLTMDLHVECQDCHNPHASRQEPPMISFNPVNPADPEHATPPFVNGSLVGVTGLDIGGNFKPEADFEYEVCLKCHGVPGKSSCGGIQCSAARGYNMSRQDRVYNLRDKINPYNPALHSYHPFAANNPVNNNEVPSLRTNTALDSINSHIYCGDCHNGDDSPAAGGSEASGPHGSRYEGILALRYDYSPESNFPYGSGQLCFKCHEASSLLADESFAHRKHVVDNGLTCINCHDPHGSAAYPHLINFLTTTSASGQLLTITGTGGNGVPVWEDKGRHSGTCYLNCHGVEHDGWSYPASIEPTVP